LPRMSIPEYPAASTAEDQTIDAPNPDSPEPAGPQGVEMLPDPVPEPIAALPEKWHRAYRSFLAEVVAIRKRATPVDRSMLVSAVRSLAGEERARDLSDKAAQDGKGDLFVSLAKLAQSEGRAARAALSSVGLSGDRRGLGEARRAAAAAVDDQTTTGPSKARWGDLLDRG